MVRRVKKKKLGVRIFVAPLMMVGITAFVYKSIIIPGYHHIFEKEYDDKPSSYSSLKIPPDSSDDRTRPVPPSEAEPDPSVSVS
jgi:D-alanyl-D-alanine carboxypeptidase (penicillin-binding protein 5/6)